MYNQKVVDYFMNPRNAGKLDDANAIGEVGNPTCGDVMKIYLKINPETEVIEDIRFETFGCAAAIATSSMVTELAKGKTIAEALKINNKDVADALGGLPPVKLHCSLLAQEGIQAAVAVIIGCIVCSRATAADEVRRSARFCSMKPRQLQVTARYIMTAHAAG